MIEIPRKFEDIVSTGVIFPPFRSACDAVAELVVS
jgi:hypothetical protein